MERGPDDRERELFIDKVVECGRCGHTLTITEEVVFEIKIVEGYGGEQYELDCPGCKEVMVLA